MRSDTSILLQLKQAHPGLFHNNLCRTEGKILEVRGSVAVWSNQPRYAPYVRFELGVEAAVVVPNPDDSQPLRIKLALGRLLATMGFANVSSFTVRDVFQGGNPTTVVASALGAFEVTVRPDRTKRGGMSVLLLRPASAL